MEIGWVAIWRKIRQHWTWKKKPFSIGQAWVDLIIRCNFQDGDIPNPSKLGPVKLKPGETIVSLSGLEEAWGWDRNKVVRLLHALKNDTMIATTNCHQYTLVNLLNYKGHQPGANNVPPEKPPQRGTDTPPDMPPAVTPILRREEGKKRKKGSARTSAPPTSPQGAEPPAPPAPSGAPDPLEVAKSYSPGTARSILVRSEGTRIPLDPEVRKILWERASHEVTPTPAEAPKQARQPARRPPSKKPKRRRKR